MTLKSDMLTRADILWRGSLVATAIAVAVIIQQFVFDGLPHVTDETSHWFQAKIFLDGRWYADLPDCPESFFQHNVVMTKDGRWFGKYPPGHTLMLALGMFMRLPEAVGPLSSGIGLLAFMSILRLFFDERVARLAGIGWVLSPQISLLAGSYMSHMTALATSLLAICWMVKAWQSKSIKTEALWSLASGFMWMLCMINRPQDAVLAAFWLGLIAVIHAPKNRKWIAIPLWAFVGSIPWIVLMMVRNFVLYDNLFTLGYYPPEESLLFPLISGSFGINEHHTWSVAWQYLIWSLYRLNFALLGWPFSFIFVPFSLFSKSFRTVVFWAGLSIIIVVVFYLFHSYYGLEYEARYYLFAVPGLLALSARGCVWLWLQPNFARVNRLAIVLIMVVFSWFAIQRYWFGRVRDVYADNFEQVSPALNHVVTQAGVDDGVVLVPSGNWHEDFRYSSGFIYNDPNLMGKVVYARDMAHMYDCLLKSFPDRRFYRAVEIADHEWQLIDLEIH